MNDFALHVFFVQFFSFFLLLLSIFFFSFLKCEKTKPIFASFFFCSSLKYNQKKTALISFAYKTVSFFFFFSHLLH